MPSLVQQWILCSEWVPSEWESDKNITIIHSPSVNIWRRQELKQIHQDVFNYKPLLICLLFWLVLGLCRFLSWFRPDHFYTGGNNRSNTLSWWLCFLQTRSFGLYKVLTDGLERCVLLWCFYQLFGLSFWRHPFTAEHSLHAE